MHSKPRKTFRPSPVPTVMTATGRGGSGAGGAVLGGSSSAADAGGSASINVQAVWLFLWLVNNIGITMGNKSAFSKVGFHYPLVASAFHMACNWLGTEVYFMCTRTPRQEVNGKQWIPLVLFSFIFSLNIIVGNVSTMMVSIPFNQVMRSLVPAVVMVIGTFMFRKTYSKARKLAVVPIMIGVALACYAEMHVTVIGFGWTCFCVILAALKVVLSGEMLTGSMKMPPLHLLSRMAPLAFLQMGICAMLVGETKEVAASWDELKAGPALWVVLATGVGSFSLNLTSLQANKVTSPLTLSIMANVKQALLIAIGIVAFSTPVTYFNFFGIAIVIAGSFLYSMLSIAESRRPPKPTEAPEGSGPLLPK